MFPPMSLHNNIVTIFDIFDWTFDWIDWKIFQSLAGLGGKLHQSRSLFGKKEIFLTSFQKKIRRKYTSLQPWSSLVEKCRAAAGGYAKWWQKAADICKYLVNAWACCMRYFASLLYSKDGKTFIFEAFSEDRRANPKLTWAAMGVGQLSLSQMQSRSLLAPWASIWCLEWAKDSGTAKCHCKVQLQNVKLKLNNLIKIH